MEHSEVIYIPMLRWEGDGWAFYPHRSEFYVESYYWNDGFKFAIGHLEGGAKQLVEVSTGAKAISLNKSYANKDSSRFLINEFEKKLKASGMSLGALIRDYLKTIRKEFDPWENLLIL